MLSKLSSDISFIILTKMLAEHPTTLADWKKQLQLLGVCQKWRHIAVPMVYKTLLAEGQCHASVSAGLAHAGNNSLIGALVSNICLASELGYNTRATMLILRMKYNTGMLEFLDQVLKLLHTSSSDWNNITQLHMQLISFVVRHDTNTHEINELVTSTVSKLAHTIPGINNLNIIFKKEDGIARRFRSQLMKAYLNKLSVIDSLYTHIPQEGHFSESITDLKLIVYNPRLNIIPKINIDYLQSLKMLDVVYYCNSKTFYSKSNCNSNILVFRNLRKLEFQTSSEDTIMQESDLYSRISFPELRELSIMHSGASRILTESNYPVMLNKLTIWSRKYGDLILYNVRFGIDERRTFAKYSCKDCMKLFHELAAYLANNQRMYSEMHAILTINIINNLPQMKAFNGCKSIQIKYANALVLAVFMSLVAGVKKIVVNLNEDTSISNKSIVGGMPFPAASICQSVEELEIIFMSETNAKNSVLFFEMVVLRTPSLMRLTVPGGQVNFDSLVAQYKDKYSHVAALHIVYKH